jgi:signal transduction histidine kinase
MLGSLKAQMGDALENLRDLARGIYPPLLAAEGLPSALAGQARKAPVEVTIDADGVGRYPQDIETAVYFCCLEALQNAAKHAPDATVVVRLEEEDGTVRFEVADNGPGFDVAAKGSGHGFVNMNDRLGAIGGTVEWDSAPGAGTRIRGSIPLAD